MYSLSVIQSINAKAAKAPKRETAANRQCSYCRSKAGIVLHSASLRSTAFLEGKVACDKFEAEWFSTNSVHKRNAIVESYFRSVPTGKRKVRAA